MSKAKRYRASGRHWKTGFTRHLVFPGKTVEQIGCSIRHNRGKAQRARISGLRPPKVRNQVRTLIKRLQKRCIGGEFKRLMNKRLSSEDFSRLYERMKGRSRNTLRKSRKATAITSKSESVI